MCNIIINSNNNISNNNIINNVIMCNVMCNINNINIRKYY